MQDDPCFSGSNMAGCLPRQEQASFRAVSLFDEATHVFERVNRRYYEYLLMAIENRAAAPGMAFTGPCGAGAIQLSDEDLVALEQALLDARQRCYYTLVPAHERHLQVGREVADGGGCYWLRWILEALAERDIVLTRADAATAPTCAPQPEVVGR